LNVNTIKAPRGQKTIAVTLYFWTDGIVPEGQAACHAWTAGEARVRANKSHGIKSTPEVRFRTMDDLTPAVEQALANAGVTLHDHAAAKASKAA
jgi:hypothetical protein